MPTTPNYGWTVPTEGGDTGVWDTILNDLADDIDEQVFTLEGDLDDLANIVRVPTGVAWPFGAFVSGVSVSQGGGMLVAISGTAGGSNTLLGSIVVPLSAGFQLDEVNIQCSAFTSGANARIRLQYASLGGSVVTVATSSAFSGSGTITLTGLAHVVLPDVTYYLQIIADSGAFNFTLGIAVTEMSLP